jgi:hypothetical protein
VANLVHPEVDVFFFDTSSTYRTSTYIPSAQLALDRLDEELEDDEARPTPGATPRATGARASKNALWAWSDHFKGHGPISPKPCLAWRSREGIPVSV